MPQLRGKDGRGDTMSVKEINTLPSTNIRIEDPRFVELMNDIREIIEKRIRTAQIFSEYPTTTTRTHIKDAIRRVCFIEYHVQYIGIFCVYSKKSDGLTNWYVTFDTDEWDMRRTQKEAVTP